MNIIRCTECNHPDYEHEEQQVPRSGNCSYGWCRCSHLRPDVQLVGVPATITPTPAFDHAAGTWVTR